MMVGKIVEARRRWPVSEIVFLLLAGLMVLVALNERRDAIANWFGAAMFVSAALVRWFSEPPRLQLLLEDRHFMRIPSGERIAYQEMLAIHSGRSLIDAADDRYAMSIQLADREILVPAGLNVSSRELEAFLQDRLVVDRSPPISLRVHVEKALAQFGEERVWWARGLANPNAARTNRGLLSAALLLIVVGIGGVIYGAANKRESLAGVSGFGMLTGFISLACSLLPASRRGLHPKVKRPHEAAVVVTPLGLAVVQGEVRGEAKWEEIRDVQHRSKPPRFAVSHGGLTTGVDVVLAGATVRILDIYDQPIHEIHQRIVAYWK